MHPYITSNVEEGFLPTCTGRRVHIAAPLPDEIDIEDIAHGLSHVCRFAGHVPLYYSVAQHSLLVSELLDERTAMWGLLHDASEAYLHDLIVHHRAQNGCDQKRDAGYFRRSIAKAHASREKDAPKPAIVMPAAPVAGEVASPSPVNGAPAPPVKGAPPPPGDGPSPPLPAVSRSVLSPEDAEERAKLLLCQEISLLLGIEVVKMVCIHGKDPTFHMHTADGVVEFDKVAKLITFRLLEDAGSDSRGHHGQALEGPQKGRSDSR